MEIKPLRQSNPGNEEEVEWEIILPTLPGVILRCTECDFTWVEGYGPREFPLERFYEANKVCRSCGKSSVKMSFSMLPKQRG